MSSKTLELDGKTIDSAIKKACREFGVSREKLNIEIISEGSSGFLGLMAKRAKIRASLLSFDMDFSSTPTFSIKKSEKIQDIVSKEKQKAEDGQHGEILPPPNLHKKIQPEEERKISHTGHTARHKTKSAPKPEHNREKQPSLGSGQRLHHRDAAAETKAAPAKAVQISKKEQTIPDIEALPATSPLALKAKELLCGILTKMTFSCQVTATETNDMIILSITGEDSAILIGRHGQNLDALQYILNKATNRADAERKKIVVDSEEYRKRREASLLQMAEKIREKVKKTQKPMSLANMNAHDRRIIHLALQEDEELVTKSRGDGDFRKVIVLPARKNNMNRAGKSKNKPSESNTKPQI